MRPLAHRFALLAQLVAQLAFALFAQLGFALIAQPARAADCPPFRELRAPTIVRDGTVWWLERGLDPDWYECVRRAGGKLTARSEIERGGAWDLDSSESNVGAHLRQGAWASNYCKRIGKDDPVRVRFVVEGTGPAAEASFRSEPLEALCGCAHYPDASLSAKASAGGVAVRVKLDGEWLACRNKGGGALELRAFAGATEADAKAAVAPTAVLRGLEKSAAFEGHFTRSALCKAGAKVAILELAGRGELKDMTGRARETVQLQCK